MSDNETTRGGGGEMRAGARFTNFIATVLTLAGVAIGLGNVWRFPYMMGSYGGSAFLVIYIIFMLTIAVPALAAELALARSYRGATITVMFRSFGRFGRIAGYLLVAGVTVASSYYTLVVGNVFYSVWYSLVHGFSPETIPQYAQNLVAPGLQSVLAVAIAWLSIFVIDRGLVDGVERVSKLFVPFFFVIALYLVYATLSLPGAVTELGRFLQPDFSRIGAREVFAAMGQCFFSSGLGAAYILVYGKYLRDDTNLHSAAACTAFSDTLASLMASLFVVPAVLVFGMHMSAGPQLLFGTLPDLFAVMPGGRLFGTLMLFALCMVAFLSVIALFQVISVSLMEEPLGQRFGRRRTLVGAGILVSLMILIPANHLDWIETMDLIFGSGFPIFGGTLVLLALTWRVPREEMLRQFGWHGTPGPFKRAMILWLQWGVPLLLAAVLGATLYDALSSAG